MDDAPLLSVRGLSIRASGREPKTIVDGLSLDIATERVALVGESGSGKSLTARALLGLLRPPLAASVERLTFEGRDLRSLSPAEWATLRGASLALTLQDARHSLNPVLRIGRQLDETLRIHRRSPAATRRRCIEEMLATVGLAPSDVLGLYAHQLSGGMAQRVMLAMALLNGPRLLIADEPTSALDAELRDQILTLISSLVSRQRMGLLLISHDLPQVARQCDRVLVMYRGRIVDESPAGQLAYSRHPYTRTLWSCKPSATTYGTELPVQRDWHGMRA